MYTHGMLFTVQAEVRVLAMELREQNMHMELRNSELLVSILLWPTMSGRVDA